MFALLREHLRRREGPHEEQSRIDGRLLATQLLVDEDDEQDRRHDGGPAVGASAPPRRAREQRDEEPGEDQQADGVNATPGYGPRFASAGRPARRSAPAASRSGAPPQGRHQEIGTARGTSPAVECTGRGGRRSGVRGRRSSRRACRTARMRHRADPPAPWPGSVPRSRARHERAARGLEDPRRGEHGERRGERGPRARRRSRTRPRPRGTPVGARTGRRCCHSPEGRP